VHGIELLTHVTFPNTVVRLRNIGTSQRRHLLLLEFADGACGVIHAWEEHGYSLTVTADSGQEIVTFPSTDSFKPMVAAVLESFESGVPVVPYREALEVVKIIQAGVASRLAGGKAVEMDSES
jgi:hypothetical protein